MSGTRGVGLSSAGAAVNSEYKLEGSGETIIVGMYTVSPRKGERYFLRLRCLHVTGAKSFVDMRTVDGEVCSSFRQACRGRGGEKVTEGIISSEFVPLSQVFATILACYEPLDVALR